MVAGGGAEAALQEPVQESTPARLCALTPDEKELLQNASVLGKVFWAGALVRIGETDRPAAEELLHGLNRKEFVRRAQRSSLGGEHEFAFRHILVRDVAYSQIPRSARLDKHLRAAEWIESMG